MSRRFARVCTTGNTYINVVYGVASINFDFMIRPLNKSARVLRQNFRILRMGWTAVLRAHSGVCCVAPCRYCCCQRPLPVSCSDARRRRLGLQMQIGALSAPTETQQQQQQQEPFNRSAQWEYHLIIRFNGNLYVWMWITKTLRHIHIYTQTHCANMLLAMVMLCCS